MLVVSVGQFLICVSRWRAFCSLRFSIDYHHTGFLSASPVDCINAGCFCWAFPDLYQVGGHSVSPLIIITPASSARRLSIAFMLVVSVHRFLILSQVARCSLRGSIVVCSNQAGSTFSASPVDSSDAGFCQTQIFIFAVVFSAAAVFAVIFCPNPFCSWHTSRPTAPPPPPPALPCSALAPPARVRTSVPSPPPITTTCTKPRLGFSSSSLPWPFLFLRPSHSHVCVHPCSRCVACVDRLAKASF
jgi:hypothetical protein